MTSAANSPSRIVQRRFDDSRHTWMWDRSSSHPLYGLRQPCRTSLGMFVGPKALFAKSSRYGMSLTSTRVETKKIIGTCKIFRRGGANRNYKCFSLATHTCRMTLQVSSNYSRARGPSQGMKPVIKATDMLRTAENPWSKQCCMRRVERSFKVKQCWLCTLSKGTLICGTEHATLINVVDS